MGSSMARNGIPSLPRRRTAGGLKHPPLLGVAYNGCRLELPLTIASYVARKLAE
jgi:hypothetical protein